MMYEELIEKQKKIEKINELLDKLNFILNSASEEERVQFLIYMDYLEMAYRRLESEIVEDNQTVLK